jgi:hypothetical protein
MRKILFILTFLILISSLAAQEIYTINEYGTYVADSKIIKKVPSERLLVAEKFLKNYVVFDDWLGRNFSGPWVFNIENGAIAEIKDDLFPGYFKILDDDKHLTFACNGYITKLDLISLEIVEKYYAGEEYNYKDIIPREWENAKYKKLGDRTVRYFGKDSYIDIMYGEDIDLKIWNHFSMDLKTMEGFPNVVYDSNLRWFAIEASPFPNDSK